MSIRMKYRVWVSGYVYAFTRRAAVLQFVLLLFSPVFELLLFFLYLFFLVYQFLDMRFHVRQDSCLAGWVMGYTVTFLGPDSFFCVIPSVCLFSLPRIPLLLRLPFNALVLFVS